MWSFAAACDVIKPCMQVAVFLVFPRLICRLCPRSSGHLEYLGLLLDPPWLGPEKDFKRKVLGRLEYALLGLVFANTIFQRASEEMRTEDIRCALQTFQSGVTKENNNTKSNIIVISSSIV